MIPQLPQISQYTVMTNDISVYVNVSDRAHLQWLIADRNTPRKVVWRAEIVLATGDGLGTMAIMRRTGQSKPCVWRWQERFVAEGVAGLLRDKTRPSRKKPLAAEVKLKVLKMTANETPANATHWSTRGMAKAVGISHNSVQRIWAEARLKPHLVSKFKVSNDPKFAC
jgi:transposase